jgi:hypothetical protein
MTYNPKDLIRLFKYAFENDIMIDEFYTKVQNMILSSQSSSGSSSSSKPSQLDILIKDYKKYIKYTGDNPTKKDINDYFLVQFEKSDNNTLQRIMLTYPNFTLDQIENMGDPNWIVVKKDTIKEEIIFVGDVRSTDIDVMIMKKLNLKYDLSRPISLNPFGSIDVIKEAVKELGLDDTKKLDIHILIVDNGKIIASSGVPFAMTTNIILATYQNHRQFFDKTSGLPISLIVNPLVKVELSLDDKLGMCANVSRTIWIEIKNICDQNAMIDGVNIMDYRTALFTRNDPREIILAITKIIPHILSYDTQMKIVPKNKTKEEYVYVVKSIWKLLMVKVIQSIQSIQSIESIECIKGSNDIDKMTFNKLETADYVKKIFVNDPKVDLYHKQALWLLFRGRHYDDLAGSDLEFLGMDVMFTLFDVYLDLCKSTFNL